MDLKETLEFIMTGNPTGILKANEEASASFAETGAASKASAEESKAASSGMSAGTVVAGAAVVGALFEMGKKWEEAALSAGKMAEATGLTSEQASRWSVVAKNNDVDTAALEKSMGFMNKTAGNSPQKFAALGISLQDANGHARSTNDVFLAVVDRLNSIKDPQERAAEGARLLGKGWMSMAELIGEGSTKLVKDMADVNDAQVFSDDKVEQAKKFRDMLKEVSNEFQSLTLKVGGFVAEIAPAIGGVVGFAASVATAGQETDKNASTFEKVKDGVLKYGNVVSDVILVNKKFVEVGGMVADQFRENHGVTGTLAESLTELGKKQEGLTSGWLAGGIAAAALSAEQAKVASSAADAKQATAEMKLQNDLTTSSYKAQATEIQNTLNAEKALIDSHRAATDASFAVESKTVAYHDALAGLLPAIAAAKGDQDKIREAYDTAVTSAASLADAQVALAEKQAAAGGSALTATEKQDAFNLSMLTSAASAKGPMKTALEDYITAANGIPAEKATAIKAAVEAGDLQLAMTLINAASADRKTAINVDVDQAALDAANRKLDQVAHDRNVKYDATGGLVGGHAFAAGTESAPGGSTVVGENGPEIVDLPAGAGVRNGTQTAQDRSMRSNTGGVHLHFYGPVMGEQDFIRRIHDGMIDGVRRGALISGGL